MLHPLQLKKLRFLTSKFDLIAPPDTSFESSICNMSVFLRLSGIKVDEALG